jgi:DNA-binding response OmpR family regulator
VSDAPARVLIVEDEARIAELVRTALEREGYACEVARDGPAGLDAARSGRPDLIILDWMLPGMDGLGVCRAVRAEADIPILMLTARDQEADTVLGLEVGADDYMTKPFGIAELRARVRALLRRARRGSEPAVTSPEVVEVGPVRLDPSRHRVEVRGVAVDLTATEFGLLEFLVRSPGQVFTREQLLDHVWGYAHAGYGRTVDSHMTRLRKKVEVAPKDPEWLITVRGVGYKFRDPA